jgi:glycine cleavage system H protein
VSDNVPADLRYTKDHEWARLIKAGANDPAGGSGDVVVGITAFAVEQLGDITLVNLDVKVGDTVTEGKAFGTIESVKTLSDLFAPVSGKVTRVNGDLANKPELVNEDCYGKAWMIAIAPSDASAHGKLLDAKAYGEHLKSAAH